MAVTSSLALGQLLVCPVLSLAAGRSPYTLHVVAGIAKHVPDVIPVVDAVGEHFPLLERQLFGHIAVLHLPGGVVVADALLRVAVENDSDVLSSLTAPSRMSSCRRWIITVIASPCSSIPAHSISSSRACSVPGRTFKRRSFSCRRSAFSRRRSSRCCCVRAIVASIAHKGGARPDVEQVAHPVDYLERSIEHLGVVRLPQS